MCFYHLSLALLRLQPSPPAPSPLCHLIPLEGSVLLLALSRSPCPKPRCVPVLLAGEAGASPAPCHCRAAWPGSCPLTWVPTQGIDQRSVENSQRTNASLQQRGHHFQSVNKEAGAQGFEEQVRGPHWAAVELEYPPGLIWLWSPSSLTRPQSCCSYLIVPLSYFSLPKMCLLNIGWREKSSFTLALREQSWGSPHTRAPRR